MKIRVKLGSRSFEIGCKTWSKVEYDELCKTLREDEKYEEIYEEFEDEFDEENNDIIDNVILQYMLDEEVIDRDYFLSAGNITVEDENYDIIYEQGEDDTEPIINDSTLPDIEKCKEIGGVCILYGYEYKPGRDYIFNIENEEFDITKLAINDVLIPDVNDFYVNATYDGKNPDDIVEELDGKGMWAYKFDCSSGELVVTELEILL